MHLLKKRNTPSSSSVSQARLYLKVATTGAHPIGRKCCGNSEAIFGCGHVTQDERRGEYHAGEDDTENSESNHGRRHV